jgi:hypothetical protein
MAFGAPGIPQPSALFLEHAAHDGAAKLVAPIRSLSPCPLLCSSPLAASLSANLHPSRCGGALSVRKEKVHG